MLKTPHQITIEELTIIELSTYKKEITGNLNSIPVGHTARLTYQRKLNMIQEEIDNRIQKLAWNPSNEKSYLIPEE